ncbi:SH3 domain-containing protein [Serratia rhizosphaerae]|uniref:SH3 domain-containing protein n=1 Tax=Serratia rhizosphaerae TaxID=2597702 RepID=UPI002DBFC419|nr:SH3 domain-containing protein [Serratia rhizosphaerae]MEB6335746.1 hypothetical protein [Serratia rhizosphaerae]
MIRTLMLALLLSLGVQPALAEAQTFNGVLQAYWLPIWHEDVNQPQLTYRFFPDESSAAKGKVINLRQPALDLKRLQQDHPEFIARRQGHVEYYGTLKVSESTAYNECGLDFYEAQKAAFTPKAPQPFDIEQLEKQSGCQSYPWLLSYQLKADDGSAVLRAAPDSSAEAVAQLSGDRPLVQIRQVNADWVQVALYDAANQPPMGKTRGYIELRHLQPLN